MRRIISASLAAWFPLIGLAAARPQTPAVPSAAPAEVRQAAARAPAEAGQQPSRGDAPAKAALRVARDEHAASPAAADPGGARERRAHVREVRYRGRLSGDEARFGVRIGFDVEGRGEALVPLAKGEVAIPAQSLPSGLRLTRTEDQYSLLAPGPGRYAVDLTLVAKVVTAETWSRVAFAGPPDSALTEVEASAPGADTDVQLQNGTVREVLRTAEGVTLRGYLGADPTLALRWRSQAAEAVRKGLVTCDTTAALLATPTVVRGTTRLRYEILQGSLARLTIALSARQVLTKLEGEQIRDWQVQPEGERQVLSVEFVGPQEKTCALTLQTEQTIEGSPVDVIVSVPEPVGVERETGTLTLSAEDVVAEPGAGPELRQENAPPGAVAAYRFHQRPLALPLKVRRIAPEVQSADRVHARLEETRWLVGHTLDLTVEKAGIYTADLGPLGDMTVAEAQGEGVEDWKAAGGRLAVQFASRVLGKRRLTVQLERPLKEFPPQIALGPLRLAGASRETAEIGIAAAPGIQLRTRELKGVREVPVAGLPERRDEMLAFRAEQPDWSLAAACERATPRLLAEVFNLVTIRDGLVSGSATVRYAILNQGVQAFRLSLPREWKNVDFVGPNIRRKDTDGETWTVQLQEKAWGGYTLVATYDVPFDPQKATVSVGGIHALDVERETGTIAISTGPSLQLREHKAVAAPPGQLFRIDETEMNPNDRALCTRSILLAYRYSGAAYDLTVDVTRFRQVPVLQAVADRTQLTTVLTPEGQLLTQTSFMVKNNAKQFQRFVLPAGAAFWGCYVDGGPVKPERDADAVLIPLPRESNRDRAFAVEVVYAEKGPSLVPRRPRPVRLAAPRTDVQTTFAEWELYVPATHVLARFGGNMTVARGTTYGPRDAWREFVRFYDGLYARLRELVLLLAVLAAFAVLMVLGIRRRWRALVSVLAVCFVLGVLGGMLLPALSSARERARRVASMSNLKQIGLALRMYSADHEEQFAPALDDLGPYVGGGSMDLLYMDPATGQRYTYIGAGRKETDSPGTILAYSAPNADGGRNVLFLDGHVEYVSGAQFTDKLARLAAGGWTSGEAEKRVEELETGVDREWRRPAMREEPPAESHAGLPAAGPAPRPTDMPAGAGVTTAGVRPIRIDVPRTGHRYVFTKVLNLADEPLAISAWAFRDTLRAVFQGSLALACFLAGLGLAWWHGQKDPPSSFGVAVGLALVLASVAGVLLIARLLGVALIAVPPLVALGVVVAWRRRRAARRRRPSRPPEPPAPVAEPVGPAAAAGTTLLVLLLGAGAARGAVAPGVTIESAVYTGTVTDRVAEIEGVLTLAADFRGGDERRVPLFGPDVAVSEFESSARHVRLVREGRRLDLRVGRRGRATVRVRFVAAPAGDVTRRVLAYGIPRALSSRLALTILEPEAAVEVPAAVWSSVPKDPALAQAGQTRLEALFGAADRIEVLWTPRVKRAAEIAATVFCQNDSLVTVGAGVIQARTRLAYQVAQGELRELRVRIPTDQRLLRVEGAGIRTWRTADEPEGGLLTVELLAAVATNYALTVETERPLGALPARLAVALPHALGVSRENGRIGLQTADDIGVSAARAEGIQKMDVEEFAAAAALLAASAKIGGAYRFATPEFTLELEAAAVRPQVEVAVINQLRIGQESLTLAARLDYTVKKAGIFTLRLDIPAGYTVTDVSGDRLAQWAEATEGGRRLLDVRLKERVTGAARLSLSLYRWQKETPRTVEAVGVYPLGADKLTGYLKIGTELGVQAKAQTADGLIEVPAATVADLIGGGVLAYKFAEEPPGSRPSWKLVLATEALPPWVRAETVQWLTLDPTEAGLAHGRAVLRYEIQNAPVKEFRLKVPSGLRNVEILGDAIRRRDQEGDTWRVELQGKVSGTVLLSVQWEQSFAGPEGDLTVACVQAVGAERESGLVAVQARPPLQVAEKTLGADWIRSDAREIPDWAGRPDESTALAYRYLRPGGTLTLGVRRFGSAEVLNAMVERAQLTSVVSEDGAMMTQASLVVRNNARQFVEVALPEGSTVWAAFVDGMAVQPAEREGRLLLPLQRVGGEAATVSLDLAYVGHVAFPRRRGRVELASPAPDVPMKDARWDLYLPPDYDYGRFRGSMTYEPEAVERPSAYAFSFEDYAQVEGKRLLARKAQITRGIRKAQQELAQQKLKDASVVYEQVQMGEVDRDADSLQAVDDIRNRLRQAQARNVITAQREFAAAASRAEGMAQPAAQVAAPEAQEAPGKGEWDESAALQWDRVQQAQELGVARVRPLHVYLPTRGLHYGFSQALQTEPGRPLTVRLRAVSTRGIGLLQGVAMAAVGLIVLWVAAGMALRRARG